MLVRPLSREALALRLGINPEEAPWKNYTRGWYATMVGIVPQGYKKCPPVEHTTIRGGAYEKLTVQDIIEVGRSFKYES